MASMGQRMVELTMDWWLFLVHLPILSTINHFACFPNGCPESIFPSHVWWLFSVFSSDSPRCDLILTTFTPHLDYFMDSALGNIIILHQISCLWAPQPSLTKVLLEFTWGENCHEPLKVLSQPPSESPSFSNIYSICDTITPECGRT